MSPSWNEFEALAELARREPVPALDVADRVLHSLRPEVLSRGRDATAGDAALWLASALSIAAAVLVVVIASYQGALAPDPLAGLFQPIIPVIQ
ncbi:MAG TPA: hypothetical protein PLF81_05275 [Candidatus Anammoximicrobium sp.]|nr:hypothetical protein [Candidatus Anammoximicrobium sp.]